MCTLKHHHTIQPQLFNPIKTEKAHTKNLLSFVRGTKCKMETCQRALVSQDLWIQKCDCGWEKLQLPRPPPSILSFQAAYLKYTICPVWSLHFSYIFPSILSNLKMFLPTLRPAWEGWTLAKTADRSAAAQPISIRLQGWLLESAVQGARQLIIFSTGRWR